MNDNPTLSAEHLCSSMSLALSSTPVRNPVDWSFKIHAETDLLSPPPTESNHPGLSHHQACDGLTGLQATTAQVSSLHHCQRDVIKT